MYKLILFDIDGTLITTGGVGSQAFSRTLNTLYKIQDDLSDVSFCGRTDLQIIHEVFQRHDEKLTKKNIQTFIDTYVFWLDHLLAQSDVITCPGVWKFLEGLQALDEPPLVGLLTGNIPLGAEIKLRQFRLWEWFQVGACGSDHEDRKQLAVIARDRANQLLGIKLAGPQILMVGDTPQDIECARKIRAHTLAVGTGRIPLKKLKALQPTFAVEHLGRLTAQDLEQ